ncbi:hypothetical protein ACJJIU_17860 [Microbulbifer sp. CnH-101-E]|uniref:hypothetical protein n=1 Tax=unclassified Microbulbifer TaxID=2619833 RepID=UPI00403971C3
MGTCRAGSDRVVLAMALTFAKMILLIADLKNANEGAQMVDQGPMSKLNLCLRALREDRSRILAAH